MFHNLREDSGFYPIIMDRRPLNGDPYLERRMGPHPRPQYRLNFRGPVDDELFSIRETLFPQT